MCELTAECFYDKHIEGRWIISDELVADLSRLQPTYIAIDTCGRIHKNPTEELGNIMHSLTFFVTKSKIAQVDFSVTSGAGESEFAELLVNTFEMIEGARELKAPLEDLQRVLFHPKILGEIERNYVLSPETVTDAEIGDILRRFESNSFSTC